MNYQEHIEELAAIYNIKLNQSRNLFGFMYVERDPPEIDIPTIDDDFTSLYTNRQSKYIVALHEIGHVHHGHTQSPGGFYYSNGVLKSEAQAWEFAMDNSKEELEPDTRKFMEWCIGTYFSGFIINEGKPTSRGYGPYAKVKFTYDQPDEYFFNVLKRIVGNGISV